MTDRFVTVTTADGALRGALGNGIKTFLGVPYAAAPVGELRFAEPAPVTPWTGVRDALEPGPTAPQQARRTFAGLDMFSVTGAEWRPGPEYLTANVWAPAAAHNAPVMVYIHGGGLVIGSKDAAVYSGARFARDGVVAVNLNYRLGAEGFLPIPGAPTNLGLRDMLAGLRWVRRNIDAFGGDPENVTVFGESGGAIAVACLMTSPLSRGLFRRAAVQSGHGSAVYPLEIARRTVEALAKELGVEASVDGFRSAGPGPTVAALSRISRPGRLDLTDDNGYDPSFGLGKIDPVYGDDVLPHHPLRALARGAGADVDLLIGTTSEEARFWFGPTRMQYLPRPAARFLLRRMTPRADELFTAYARAFPAERGGATLIRVLSDLSFRRPARQFAQAHPGRTHMYEFEWRSPAAGGRLGAAHGMELPFVFDTLDTVTGPGKLAGDNPPQSLADHTHRLWIDFAATGELPWPPFDPRTRPVYQIARREPIHEEPLVATTLLESSGSVT
ncbi:carboxylesterase/lipase family protein [Actinoplanes sp. NPDC049265]|uniref:carboxylesterase/lipase family protein n=1 Tax=Actinoplanes sp. NPDC049265 TaxID=3363902 RepID=UPI00371055D6